jgi:hypothetical protein
LQSCLPIFNKGKVCPKSGTLPPILGISLNPGTPPSLSNSVWPPLAYGKVRRLNVKCPEVPPREQQVTLVIPREDTDKYNRKDAR